MDNKRKIPIWAKIIAISLSVLLLGLLAMVVFVNTKLNNLGEIADPTRIPVEEQTFDADDPEGEYSTYPSAKIIDPEEIIWPSMEEVESSDGVTNILLEGYDTRIEGQRGRSDCMIIASVNTNNNTVKLVSLMRDMYVQIPGYSDNRINASYAFGGISLLDETIKLNFGVEIDYNIVIDFFAFVTAIDTLGGVDLQLTKKEIPILNNYISEINRIRGVSESANKVSSDSEGTFQANGTQALAYCRIRYVPTAMTGTNNDYGRTERQRYVINAIFKKLKSESLASLNNFADAVFPMVSTDMTNMAILSFIYTVWHMNLEELETTRIPADNTYESALIRSMSVLVPDLPKNRKLLQEFLYS